MPPPSLIQRKLQMSEPFLGQITMFGFNFPPRGWATCEGQLLAISQNSALFSLLGTTYGGDGRTTFALPDLRGRAPIGPGQGSGLSNIQWGQRGGNEQTALTNSQLPSHTHTATVNCVKTPGNTNQVEGAVWANDAGTQSATYATGQNDALMRADAISLQNTGSGLPFSIRSPYIGIYYCIALVGIFPSRS